MMNTQLDECVGVVFVESVGKDEKINKIMKNEEINENKMNNGKIMEEKCYLILLNLIQGIFFARTFNIKHLTNFASFAKTSL